MIALVGPGFEAVALAQSLGDDALAGARGEFFQAALKNPPKEPSGWQSLRSGLMREPDRQIQQAQAESWAQGIQRFFSNLVSASAPNNARPHPSASGNDPVEEYGSVEGSSGSEADVLSDEIVVDGSQVPAEVRFPGSGSDRPSKGQENSGPSK